MNGYMRLAALAGLVMMVAESLAVELPRASIGLWAERPDNEISRSRVALELDPTTPQVELLTNFLGSRLVGTGPGLVATQVSQLLQLRSFDGSSNLCQFQRTRVSSLDYPDPAAPTPGLAFYDGQREPVTDLGSLVGRAGLGVASVPSATPSRLLVVGLSVEGFYSDNNTAGALVPIGRFVVDVFDPVGCTRVCALQFVQEVNGRRLAAQYSGIADFDGDGDDEIRVITERPTPSGNRRQFLELYDPASTDVNGQSCRLESSQTYALPAVF